MSKYMIYKSYPHMDNLKVYWTGKSGRNVVIATPEIEKGFVYNKNPLAALRRIKNNYGGKWEIMEIKE